MSKIPRNRNLFIPRLVHVNHAPPLVPYIMTNLFRHVVIILLTVLPLSTSQNDSVLCPLNFDLLRRLVGSDRLYFDGVVNCLHVQHGIQLVVSDYLHRTGNFYPPLSTAESCWRSYQTLSNDLPTNLNLRKICGFETDWISISGCMNITNRLQFENLIPSSSLNAVVSACNHSLSGRSCSACTAALSNLQTQYLNGESVGNLTNCLIFPVIYAAALVSQFGPTDRGTAVCLFSLDFDYSENNHKLLIIVTVMLMLIVFVSFFGFWHCRKIKLNIFKRRLRNENVINLESTFDSIESSSLIRYSIEEIKEATRSFSIDNIIGKGGFGNVYKGLLVDNTEVAVKRFKNCSAAGEASFTHEVGVIASVRHVNLVGLRGYCIATTPFEGYQRIIVTDLVKNGSLHDHLFGSYETRVNLNWPMRRKIALGMARGLAYLHYGAQPAIIHRDIKASNILIDENFEAKVADFGLAKFAPEGATHLSTRVAGTMGYLAPEYALYGQLTERSDVYSFGVVLLELLTGKKALLTVMDEDGNPEPILLADWAWSVVWNGTPLEVIDKDMTECGSLEFMEKYVLVAVLSSHPQLYARPTMDLVLKMLDSDLPVPSIPERPIPLVVGLEDFTKYVSSSGSGHLSTPRGHRFYTGKMDGRFATKDEAEKEDDEGEETRLSNGR